MEQFTNASRQHEPFLSLWKFDSVLQTLIMWAVRYVLHSKELQSSCNDVPNSNRLKEILCCVHVIAYILHYIPSVDEVA